MSNLTYKNRCTCLSMKVTALRIITNNLSAQPGNAHPDSRGLCVCLCVFSTPANTSVICSLPQQLLLIHYIRCLYY